MSRKTEPWKDVEYWKSQRDAYWDCYKDALEDYREFRSWYSGDMGSVLSAVAQSTRDRKNAIAATNFVSLVARAVRAELVVRNPRFIVSPTQGYGATSFTPQLSGIETALLDDVLSETGFFRQMRKALIDGILGPFMCLKIGYSADVGVDDELVEAEMLVAQGENEAIRLGGRPRVKDTDYHRGHIEAHEGMIALVERGDIQVPKRVLTYLKNHTKKHADMLLESGGREVETVRNESIFVRRRNPLRVSFDPFAECAEDREWVCDTLTRNIDDVRANEDYDSSAVKALQVCPIGMAETGGREGTGTEYESDDSSAYKQNLTVLWEVVSLRHRKVILYGYGSDKPLQVRDYKLSRIMPSGPLITQSFIEDLAADGDIGVPIPRLFHGQQLLLALLETCAATTAKRSVPKMVYDKSAVDATDIERIRRGVPAAAIGVNMPAGKGDIRMLIQELPLPSVPDFMGNMMNRAERGIERVSGLGSAKTAGGDFSRTATATAVVDDAVSKLSEDLASVVDDFMGQAGSYMLRLIRKFTNQARVLEVVGDKAIKYWPVTWADRDIVRDRNVRIVPGSTRRRSTAVELKSNMELYSVLAQDPMVPPEVRVELLRRILEYGGMPGVDLGPMQQQLALMQMQQAIAAAEGDDPNLGGETAPGRDNTGPAARTQRRATRSGEGTQAAVQQGARNSAGGPKAPNARGR